MFAMGGAVAQTPAGPAVKAIVGATVVNLDGGEPIRDAVVVIEGERIKALGPSGTTAIPRNAQVIRAPGTWLVPGLMNMHVHPELKLPGRDEAALADETTAELALRMMVNARKSLEVGVTTIRLPGTTDAGIALREAIKRGDYDGPRIHTGGGITMTAGHGSQMKVNGSGGRGQTYNDGPYEMVKATRARISEGHTWIKIAISGGLATDGGGIGQPLMTPEEIDL